MTQEMMRPLLQSYYSQAFPERQDAQICELINLNDGWECEVYGFRVEWGPVDRRQSENLILRLYPGADAVTKSANEYKALTMLYQAGYPVPRVDRLEQDPLPLGKPFIMMEAIPGRSMWGPMFHPEMPDNSPTEDLLAEYGRNLSLFCSLFARLHAIDWRSRVPNPAEYEPAGLYGVVDRAWEGWKPIFDALPLPGFQPTLDWLTAHRHDTPSQQAALVHWDFHPNNILITPEGRAFVIDWTSLDISDYRFDLAWTLLLLTSSEGPQWREPILREYERQAGHPVTGLTFFDAAACFRRLYSVMVSLAFGADKLGMRPGAEEQMRRHARPLRSVYEQLRAMTGLPIPEVEAFLSEQQV